MAKFSLKTVWQKLVAEAKAHWHEPAEGNYVPYKEWAWLSISEGGSSIFNVASGRIYFGSTCYLIMYYFNIPLLWFTVIGLIGLPMSYVWSVLGWNAGDNLGYLPKKFERKYYIINITSMIIGLILIFFVPANTSSWLNEKIMPGAAKIFGIQLLCNGHGGARGVFYRKRFLKKLGRSRMWIFINVIPYFILVFIILFLPWNKWVLTDRCWRMYLTFCLLGTYTFNQITSVVYLSTPNDNERMKLHCYPVQICHILGSFTGIIVAGLSMYTGGATDIRTFRYILAPFLVIGGILVVWGARHVHERIPLPPPEKKKHYDFWTGTSEVLRNKYRWLTTISGIVGSFNSGAIGLGSLIWIYFLRETDWVMGVATLAIATQSTPGTFVAPWICKKRDFKSIYVFSRTVAITAIILELLLVQFFTGKYLLISLLYIFISYMSGFLNSVNNVAMNMLGLRITDYQMWLSGERLEGYSGVFGWISAPFTTLLALIVPVTYKYMGFTSDWDIFYDDAIVKRITTFGLLLAVFSNIVASIPYLFFDLTNEKHKGIIAELERRKAAIENQEAQAVTDATAPV